jgi:autotransporter-associated beta strand protein
MNDRDQGACGNDAMARQDLLRRAGEPISVARMYPAHSVCRLQRHTECAGYIAYTTVTVRSILSRGVVLAAGIVLFLSCAHALADDVVPVATLRLPDCDVNAYTTSARYNSDGILYAWDGFQVWRQNEINSSSFTPIGMVIGGTKNGQPYNCADAGPINFSADGTEILLGNGGGGQASMTHKGETWHANRVWSMPILGGQVNAPVATIPGHFDFVPVPAGLTGLGSDTAYFVDQGTKAPNVYASSVSVFDKTKGTNVTVIDHVPGSSASIAVNPQGDRLYVGVGYDPTHRGDICSFSFSQIASAYASGTPLDFLSGDFFNPEASGNQSGTGMFVTANGYLFSGGNEGVTCFKPDGTVAANLPMPDGYTYLTYNPLNNQVLALTGFSLVDGAVLDAHDFMAGAPTQATWSGATTGGTGWKASAPWGGTVAMPMMSLVFAAPSGGANTANFNDFAPGTWFKGIAFANDAPAYTLEGNRVTLQGPVTNHSANRQTIALDLTLGSDTTLAAAGGDIEVTGNIDGSGGLAKSGPHALVLSGRNSYAGGTTVSEGVLQFAAADSLPADSNVTVLGSAVVVFGSGFAGPITAAAATDPQAVPEPGSFVLLAAAATAIGWRWRRRHRQIRRPDKTSLGPLPGMEAA